MAMAIFATALKALFIIAIPITLIVYACVFVGAAAEQDYEKRHAKK